MMPDAIFELVDDLLAWLEWSGSTRYDGTVTQLEHALQTAYLADRAGTRTSPCRRRSRTTSGTSCSPSMFGARHLSRAISSTRWPGRAGWRASFLPR